MKHTLYLLLLCFLFASCEDKIDLDVPEGPEKLVVDALLTDGDSLQTITLSRTSPYFESSRTPRVSGAQVYVTTSAGQTIIFTENPVSKGDYEAIYEMTDTTLGFVMHVKLPDGRQYESYEERLHRVSPIDSLRQSDEKYPARGDFRKEGYAGLMTTYEPSGMGDYYRWIIFVNGEKLIDPFSLIFADDRLVDGNPIIDWDIVYELQEGDTVEIHQMSISERAYHYWTLIFAQITNFGGPFSTPPATIEGNIFRVGDEEETVLGFFGVSRVSKAMMVVK